MTSQPTNSVSPIVDGFTAQQMEDTVNAKVMGSITVEAWFFFYLIRLTLLLLKLLHKYEGHGTFHSLITSLLNLCSEMHWP